MNSPLHQSAPVLPTTTSTKSNPHRVMFVFCLPALTHCRDKGDMILNMSSKKKAFKGFGKISPPKSPKPNKSKFTHERKLQLLTISGVVHIGNQENR